MGATLDRLLRTAVFWGLQPMLIVAALLMPLYGASESQHFFFWTSLLVLLTVLEIMIPARPAWRGSVKEKAMLFGFVLIGFFAYGFVEGFFSQTLFPWLEATREQFRLNIWPSDWPILMQVFLVFAGFEFVNYWYHRGAHGWGWLWKLSGHGAHHAFKHLSALNTLANHPFEVIFLMLPRMVVGYLLGGEVVAVAVTSLTFVATLMAHCNLNVNTKIIGLFFTTNRYHIHHHSMVHQESNTNFGCACIIWDRLFGTFQDADTVDTGIGKTQPSYRELFLMPFVEPAVSETAPGAQLATQAAE